MAKLKKLVLLIILPLLLGGCWDKVEIERRAYVSATGIDVYYPEETGETVEEEEENLVTGDKLLLTYVYPNLKAIGENGGGEPRFVVASVASSSFEATRQINVRSNQNLFFKHMKSVVLGEELARNPDYLKQQLDTLDRHNQISRKLNLFVADGTAKEILNLESKFEPNTGTYLSEISAHASATSLFNPLTLGDILQYLHTTGNALIPRVISGRDDLKLVGSGVIKNYALIGWLSQLENAGVMYLRDEVSSDIATVIIDGLPIPFLVTESTTSRTLVTEGDDFKINISIELEGYIQQYELGTQDDVMDEKLFKEIEKQVEEKIKQVTRHAINKVQKEFKVDVLDIGNHIRKYNSDLWKQVKGDWEEIFPNVPIKVDVTVYLRRVGMTR